MSPDLVALANSLFAAARSNDPRRLAAHYSPDFTALQIERDAQVQHIPAEDLLAMMAGEHQHSWAPGSVDEVDLLHTAVQDGRGMVVYRWSGFEPPAMVFTLVWDLATAPPLLVCAVAVLPGP